MQPKQQLHQPQSATVHIYVEGSETENISLEVVPNEDEATNEDQFNFVAGGRNETKEQVSAKDVRAPHSLPVTFELA